MAMDSVVREIALRLGFDAVGVADAEVALDEDFARYEAFVSAGFHGSMGYLAQNADVRRSVACHGILSGAKSVVCVVQRYAVSQSGESLRAGSSPESGVVSRIARYARGLDYHKHVGRRLRELADAIRLLEPGAMARPLLDTAPVLERAWAVRAGLGFIGKNGMLIRPGLGSFIVLGEVVTSISLGKDIQKWRADVSRCGSCTACLRACPNKAFVEPYVMDARRCISYLTIEHRGRWDDGASVGRWFFGCDACQDVCPYNKTRGAFIESGGPFDTLPRWKALSLLDVVGMSPDEIVGLREGSAMKRVRIDDIRRNALGALLHR